jgi:formylglycine-generating enzyme required for sulfatase activity
MPSSARAVFIEPDAWDRTALWWFTAVAAGSAACASAEPYFETCAWRRLGAAERMSAPRTRDHRALTKKLRLVTLKRLDALYARRPVGHTEVASIDQPEAKASANMIWIPGGTFRMGSDKHYPEEAPFIASRSAASGLIARR